ncbi:cGMP-dependent protein kinase [Cymbomonas tetramitiformis]|uniref:cGMP-dependent protein kinase n=1 Tax=Cymbomonas tetramitiformis TaxID=36881 RepID=A0AAE0C8I3_9CHLO|nr:cGMP-dependent protein kinase [Cymbomonas tetramitiformis]
MSSESKVSQEGPDAVPSPSLSNGNAPLLSAGPNDFMIIKSNRSVNFFQTLIRGAVIGLIGWSIQRLLEARWKSRRSEDQLEDEALVIDKPDEVEKLAVLGEGGYALVLLVSYKSNLYALKTLKKSHVLMHDLTKLVMRERDIGMACSCPFLVNFMGTYQDKDNLYMMMEPVLGGELYTYLEKHSLSDERGIPEATATFYAACTIIAFEYLHARNYVYRDLKPENMLIDTTGYLKLADLGFAKMLTDPLGKTYTTCGTLDYMAPEMVEMKGHNKGADWWALGTVIYEMVTGLPPFHDLDDDKVKVQHIKRSLYSTPEYMSPECMDVIKKLLTPDPEARLGNMADGVIEVKRHSWFRHIDWDLLVRMKHPVPYVPSRASTCFEKYCESTSKHPAGKEHDVMTGPDNDMCKGNFQEAALLCFGRKYMQPTLEFGIFLVVRCMRVFRP